MTLNQSNFGASTIKMGKKAQSFKKNEQEPCQLNSKNGKLDEKKSLRQEIEAKIEFKTR